MILYLLTTRDIQDVVQKIITIQSLQTKFKRMENPKNFRGKSWIFVDPKSYF